MKYKNGGFRILQVYDIEIDKRRDFIMEWKYAKKLKEDLQDFLREEKN